MLVVNHFVEPFHSQLRQLGEQFKLIGLCYLFEIENIFFQFLKKKIKDEKKF
jgi:hypothetical protein